MDTGYTAFQALFGHAPTHLFSAPGRTEIAGNHTDHQHGRVLAAAVSLETQGWCAENGSDVIRVCSEGYAPCEVKLDELQMKPEERNTTTSLIRGIAARMAEQGCPLRGLDVYVTSTVLPGSGLSSSAAFEVLIGTMLNALFFDGRLTPTDIAIIGQWAENNYFGKPSGLMDQMASSVGGVIGIDFQDVGSPAVTSVPFDFSASGCTLCIIDTRASHAELTGEYAAIPVEMKRVAACFGQEVLRQVDEEAFYDRIAEVRAACGDRAVLRAMHFFAENRRVADQIAALQRGDFAQFLRLVNESGESSWLYLQNITPAGAAAHQEVALTLALCRRLLRGAGACRIHGGGFAGTVLAFVPDERLEDFRAGVERVLGAGACHVLAINPAGGRLVRTF